MVQFFVPDGDGGAMPPEKAEQVYADLRAAAEKGSFWSGTFTDRRVHALTSRHNGREYGQRVGQVTSDAIPVLAIFHSRDEHNEDRYVVQSLTQTVHVDPDKVVDVTFFDEP